MSTFPKDHAASIAASEYRHALAMMRLHLKRLGTGPGDAEKVESLEAIERAVNKALQVTQKKAG